MKSLNPFFNPKSVAVIGASHEPTKIGYVVLKNFIKGDYTGKVYPVNPDTRPILGLNTYASVKDIPKPVDLAVIVVPARIVPKVLVECGEKGVKAVVIITSGFKEIGGEGAELEQGLKKIIAGHGLSVVGANCLGVFDAFSGVDTLFLPSYRLGRPHKGSISFITQSGAFGSTILDWAALEGFGVSKFVSYGNATDVDEVHLLEYLAHDPRTNVISMYMEGATRPRDLLKVAERATRKKPVLCFKAGSSAAGTKAALSHTGTLAGSDRVYDAAFKQSGIIRVKTIEEMFDYSRALALQPLPKGNRIAIVTDGGGFGVMATDAIEKHGLELAKLGKKSIEELRKITLPYASLKNPIDITGSATSDMYKDATSICMNDENVDGIIVILLFQPPNIESDIVPKMLNINARKTKPILVCSAGGEYTQVHRNLLEKSGMPTFPTPERAVKAMAALLEYSKIKMKPI